MKYNTQQEINNDPKHPDNIYLNMVEHILKEGVQKGDRTGTGTKSIFGYQMRFDLSHSFPLLITKNVPIKSIIHELIWFMRGDHNIKYLVDNNVSIWNEWPYKAYLKKNNLPVPDTNSDEWKIGIKEFVEKIKSDNNFATEYGDLGPVYGKQWRNWVSASKNIDQLFNIVEQIKSNPDSRRLIVSAWNSSEIEEMAKAGLPPCHCLFQFYVANNKLSCQLYQRSCDTFLGVPFNIASYALLTMIIAKMCDLEYGEFVWTGGDIHIYNNHFAQVEEQLSRRNELRESPQMIISENIKNKTLEEIVIEDFELKDYNPHPPIKGQIAV